MVVFLSIHALQPSKGFACLPCSCAEADVPTPVHLAAQRWGGGFKVGGLPEVSSTGPRPCTARNRCSTSLASGLNCWLPDSHMHFCWAKEQRGAHGHSFMCVRSHSAWAFAPGGQLVLVVLSGACGLPSAEVPVCSSCSYNSDTSLVAHFATVCMSEHAPMLHAQACAFDEELMLAACGDFCGPPNAEGALLSGLAAARAVSAAVHAQV